ncbi:hypothetical protein [Sorangium sp. So ce1335]
MTRNDSHAFHLSDSTCIVPRGVWHRQIVPAPSVMIFITPGDGTQHRAC